MEKDSFATMAFIATMLWTVAITAFFIGYTGDILIFQMIFKITASIGFVCLGILCGIPEGQKSE